MFHSTFHNFRSPTRFEVPCREDGADDSMDMEVGMDRNTIKIFLFYINSFVLEFYYTQ